MIDVYIAFGSNLADPLSQLSKARDFLRVQRDWREVAASPIVLTPAWGYEAQDDFYNAVVHYHTTLSPLAVLDLLQSVEAKHHRRRPFKNAPRTLDLDLLLYGDTCLQNDRLTLPHPHMLERGFVLYPFFLLAPDLVYPNGNTVANYWKKLDISPYPHICGVQW